MKVAPFHEEFVKIISIKRTPLQQFLFSDDDNLYDDLYFDYKLQIHSLQNSPYFCVFK